MYKSLNEFEIWSDATTGFHGNHRVIMGKMLSALYIAPSFLIGSSSYYSPKARFINDNFHHSQPLPENHNFSAITLIWKNLRKTMLHRASVWHVMVS